MSVLSPVCGPPSWAPLTFDAGYKLGKIAAVTDPPEIAYNLSGMLYLSSSGWLLLSVPNALVMGVFLAMHEPGAELPIREETKRLNAHISVFHKDEVAKLGADRITERGKQFRYTIGRLYAVEPANWPEMSKVWFLRVHSPELQDLRRSYGLSSLPNDGKHDFHITVAVKRRGVLARNDTAKGGV